MTATCRALHRIDGGALAEVTSALVVALLFLVIWLPLSAPSVRGVVYVPPDDTVAKFRMSLGNHGNPLWLFPRNNDTMWVTNTSSPVLSSPVVSAGRVYVGTMGGSVLCLSATSGSVLWEHVTGGPIESTPAVERGRVYIGSDDRGLHCLDASTGKPIWNTSTGGEIKSSPAVWQGLVIVGSNDYGVHCLNATTGAPVWNFSTGGWVYSSPAVWEGRAYIGSCDGRLYCLNATTGVEHWRFEARYMPASPAVVGGVVLVGAYDDRLYALDAMTGAEMWNASIGEGGIYSSAAFDRPARLYVDAFVGDNGGHLSMIRDGVVLRNWALGGSVKSSPVHLQNITDEVPRPPPLDAVIVGTEAGEVVAVNPMYNATDAFYGPEFWWRLRLGTSVTASPFMYNERVYISAANGDGGVIACIGDLWYGEDIIQIDTPVQGAHVESSFDVHFHGTGLAGDTAKVIIGESTFPATWWNDHWLASVSLGGPMGPMKVIARVLGPGDKVLAEDSIDVVVRDPDGPLPKLVIVKPEEDARVDPVAVARGHFVGDYPPLRLEASWDGSGCWTAFAPLEYWTLALTTAGLDDGRHTLRVRAFDGMFVVESSVKVMVGEDLGDISVGDPSVLAIIILLTVVVVLILTRPKLSPRT